MPANLSAFPSTNYFRLVSGGGVLALGIDSALFKPTGGSWTQCVMPDGVVIEHAAHDGTQFLGEDDGVIYQSLNGINWAVLAGAQNLNLFGLAFGNGRWVGFDGDNLYHSVDGLTWATISHEDAFVDPGVMRYHPNVTFLGFSGGKFVVSTIEDQVCGFNTYGTSSDGINWSIAPAPRYDRIDSLGNIIESIFDEEGKEIGPDLDIQHVSLSSGGDPLVIHSLRQAVNNYSIFDDGRLISPRSATANPAGVAVAVGSGENFGLILRTENFESNFWEYVGVPNYKLVDSESNGETLVAVYCSYLDGIGGSSSVFHTSNGVSWARCRFPDSRKLDVQGVRFVNGTWFLTSYDYESRDPVLYTSANGIDWDLEEFTPITTEYDDFGEIVNVDILPIPVREGFGNGWMIGRAEYFLGGGFQAGPELTFARSQNGRDWEELPEELSEMTAGGFGNGQFVALSQGTAWTSVDGEEWASIVINGLAGPPSLLRYYRGRWLTGNPETFIPPFNLFPTTSYFSTDLVEWADLLVPPEFNSFQMADSFELRGWQIAGDHCSKDGIRWVRSEVFFDWRPRMLNEFSVFKAAPLGDRIVLLTDDFQTTRSHPVSINPTPRELRVVDPGYVEAPVDPAFEYRLNFSSDLGVSSWAPIGDWKSAGGVDPFLFWVTEINDPFGFYRMEYRARE